MQQSWLMVCRGTQEAPARSHAQMGEAGALEGTCVPGGQRSWRPSRA